MNSRKKMRTFKRPFRVFERLEDLYLEKALRKRAARHLVDGCPPVAIFAFDYIGRSINQQGRFERNELEILFTFLAPLFGSFAKTSALDIGANIGNHSLFFAEYFKSVQAFEPNPNTYAVLEYNSSLKDNIVTHQVGLGRRNEKLSLSLDLTNVGEARVTETALAGGNPVTQNHQIQIARLDDLAPQFGPVSFVKMDVEGFEAEVIAGGLAFLSSQMPIIAFEQNTAAFEGGSSVVIDRLRDIGYKFCTFEKRNESGKGLQGYLNTVRKILRGTEYDLFVGENVPAGTYPMLLAINERSLASLTT